MRISFFASARDVKKQITGKTLRQNAAYIISLKGDAHWLGLSFAIGLFIGTTPFYGAHTVLALMAISIFRFNLPTLLIGAWLTMPPILPFIYYAGYRIGRFVLPGLNHVPRALLFDTINKIMTFDVASIRETKEVVILVKQLFLGCTVLGLCFSVTGYFLLRFAVERYRAKIHGVVRGES
jgi:uncharacterized protein